MLSLKLLSSLSDSQGEVMFLHAQPQIKVLLLFPLCSCASPYLTHCPSLVLAVPSIAPSTDHIPLRSAPRSEDNLISRCSCSFFNLSHSLLSLLPLQIPSTVGSCKWQKKSIKIFQENFSLLIFATQSSRTLVVFNHLRLLV